MHQQTMVLLKKSQGSAVAEYAPIAKMTTLDEDAERKLNRKFEIAYFLCKQNLSFTKIAPLWGLQVLLCSCGGRISAADRWLTHEQHQSERPAALRMTQVRASRTL